MKSEGFHYPNASVLTFTLLLEEPSILERNTVSTATAAAWFSRTIQVSNFYKTTPQKARVDVISKDKKIHKYSLISNKLKPENKSDMKRLPCIDSHTGCAVVKQVERIS